MWCVGVMCGMDSMGDIVGNWGLVFVLDSGRD